MNLRSYSKFISGDERRIKLALPSSMSPLLLEVRLRDAKFYFKEDLVKYKWYREKVGEVLTFNRL